MSLVWYVLDARTTCIQPPTYVMQVEMQSDQDVFKHSQDYDRRLFIIYTSNIFKAVVGVALILLPTLELWREQISIKQNRLLFALDVLCMVVVSIDAALAIYFKNLQSQARGPLCNRSTALSTVCLYPLLWLAWTLQQLGICSIASFIMPLLLFVTNSELRVTVTIFVRCDPEQKSKC